MRLALLGLALLAPLTACGGKGPASPESNAVTMPATGSPSSASSAPSATSDPGLAATSTPAASATATSASPPADPIAATLPIDLGAKVPAFARRSVTPPKAPMIARGIVPVPEGLAPQIDPALPFFAWEEVMSPGVVLSFPKHVGLDLYVAIFDGEVSVKAGDIAGKQKRLWRWNAARVPGLGALVECKEPTRAIFVLVTNTPGATLGQAGAAGQKVDWSKRPAPVVSVELDKQPDFAWGGGAYHARLGFEDGSASLGSLVASKNATIPQNVHDHEWELLAVLSGDGTLARTPAPGAAEDDAHMTAGSFVSIAPGVPHTYRPAGTSPLVAVQLFLPPGPEQRFKKLASGGN